MVDTIRLYPPAAERSDRTLTLDQHLNGLVDAETSPDGARGLRILCMIDEAHQILGTRLPSLSRLIRMSRSKGGAVMLVSQSPDDFSGEDDEFLDNMAEAVGLKSNVLRSLSYCNYWRGFGLGRKTASDATGIQLNRGRLHSFSGGDGA
jgi:type IV secretory pathway VirB4 component